MGKIPRKIDIVLFLGAGASAPFGYPTTKQFLENLAKKLSGNHRELLQHLMKVKGVSDIEHVLLMLNILPDIKKNLSALLKNSRASMGVGKRQVTFDYLIEVGLSLRELIRGEIFLQYELNPERRNAVLDAYEQLFTLVGDYQKEGTGFTVFTTNYDRVIEDFCLNSQYELVNGFLHEPASRAYSWAPKQFEGMASENTIKLFKLHGSLNWLRRTGGSIIEVQPEQRIGSRRRFKENILIYPASKEAPMVEPFITLYDSFEKHLIEADVLVSIGFSYRDEYINELLARSLGSKRRFSFLSIGGGPETLMALLGKKSLRFFSSAAPEFPKPSTLKSLNDDLDKISLKRKRRQT